MLCVPLWAQCVTDIPSLNLAVHHRDNAEVRALNPGKGLLSKEESSGTSGPHPGDLRVYTELRGDRQTGRNSPNVFR